MGTKKTSAGILLFRRKEGLAFFLVHPGGPFFAKKDAGSWSIPKGEFDEREDPLGVAKKNSKKKPVKRSKGIFLRFLP